MALPAMKQGFMVASIAYDNLTERSRITSFVRFNTTRQVMRFLLPYALDDQ